MKFPTSRALMACGAALVVGLVAGGGALPASAEIGQGALPDDAIVMVHEFFDAYGVDDVTQDGLVDEIEAGGAWDSM